MNIHNKIIDYIKKNRISTAEVSDALGKKGALNGILPLNSGHYQVGKVEYVCAWGGSNWSIHEQIQSVDTGKIIFVDAIECEEKAIFGDLVSKYLCLYKSSKALVVNGSVRDLNRLIKENYPIWSKGRTPVGCSNVDVTPSSEVNGYIKERAKKFSNSILVLDDAGCVLIEEDEQTEEFLRKLEFIELQEDIWYFCIDTLKLSTFETICEKVYLRELDLLPAELKQRLEKYKGDLI